MDANFCTFYFQFWFCAVWELYLYTVCSLAHHRAWAATWTTCCWEHPPRSMPCRASRSCNSPLGSFQTGRASDSGRSSPARTSSSQLQREITRGNCFSVGSSHMMMSWIYLIMETGTDNRLKSGASYQAGTVCAIPDSSLWQSQTWRYIKWWNIILHKNTLYTVISATRKSTLSTI